VGQKLRFLKTILSDSELTRFEVMKRIGKWILPQYRFKWPQMAWWQDRQFNDYLKRFDEIDGMNTDRRWMLYQLIRLVGEIPGDTSECGVYKGAGSYLICQFNREDKELFRTHFMFDSFEGISAPTKFDGSYWREGDLSCGMDVVKENLGEFENISIHKGWIPERFSDIEDKRFAFVHVDVDLYEPTRDSIHFFYPRMNQGGIILCDDYGFTSCPGATRAIDEFLADKPEKMISLSCGGGFLIKGIQTTRPFIIRQ
jgi:O-methyltransferase